MRRGKKSKAGFFEAGNDLGRASHFRRPAPSAKDSMMQEKSFQKCSVGNVDIG